MANGGFFEQKSASPTRFALVAAGHAAVLAAVMLAAGPQFTRLKVPPIIVDSIPLPEPPPSDPEAEPTQRQTPIRIPVPTPERPPELPPSSGPIGQTGDPPVGPVGGTIVPDPPRDPPPIPIRHDAQIDPRFASALQPLYPSAEQRAGRSGLVVIRVTIGTDGRVRSAERVSATSDLFWAAAERQALNRWRFRPATVDGRPVESTRTMTIHFRIEDV